MRSLRKLSKIAALLASGAALGACGGGGSGAPKDAPAKDALVDAPPDALCGSDASWTGEVIDFDSFNSSGTTDTFCGVLGTKVAVRTMTKMPSVTTAPNGRFVGLCVPTATNLVDITPPTGNNGCPTNPGSYPKAGILIADSAVVAAGGFPSVRLLSTTAMTQLYDATDVKVGDIDAAYNVMDPQVVIHFTGNPHQITTSSQNFNNPQQFNGTMWVPMTGTVSGSDVLYPNLNPTSPITFTIAGGTPSSVTLAPTNPQDATAPVTLVPDKFTYVTIVTP